MAQNYRVYLSSTYADLQECRKAVYSALQKIARVDKVVAMEDYVATDQRPLDKVLADVDGCDIYVGIFAWRYGFVPSADNPEGRSITELEFRRARSAGKHCLIFVLDKDASWKRSFQDDVTGENDRGSRIGTLRTELLEGFLASSFSDPQQLGGLAAAAVANYIASRQPPAAAPRPDAEATPHFRELRSALYLVHSPLDEAVARGLAVSLGTGLAGLIRISTEALFAAGPGELAALDQAVTRCHAALVPLTAASLGQLAPRAEEVATVLDVLRTRTGAAAAVLVDTPRSSLPPAWAFDAVFEISSAGAGQPLDPAALAPARQWLEGAMPPFGVRTIGVPVCVLSMNVADLAALESSPDFLTNRLGKPAADQYQRLKDALTASGIAWKERYQASRTEWRPFSHAGRGLALILQQLIKDLNRRALPKLKHRHLKLQWYPFDALLGGGSALRQTYREVARTGLIMVVDELSLFHPDLREAFQNSPFFNNDQVAIVTISPFDPGGAPLEQLLEAETRRKLAGAFDRYAVDYDPQCELAVGDERRLKRWLHLSLPETVTRLQELQPDRSAMRDFFAQELQGESARPKGDYLWASGGRP
jgi:hypothetical protein